MSDTQYQCTMIIPQAALSSFDSAFEPFAAAVSLELIEKGPDKGCWQIGAIFEGMPDVGALQTALAIAAASMDMAVPSLDLVPVPNKNWLKECLQSFPPRTLGRYYIYGSHIKTSPPADKIALKIDAATAFGSGEHATTQGCLTAFDALFQTYRPKTILDMGCGSGILAMAAVKALNENVTVDAVDIDPESVQVTTQNCIENGVADYVTVWQSVGYENVPKSYDLIFANILARPLVEMADELYRHLAVGGYAILSGFLNRQEKWVLKAHEKAGLTSVQNIKIKEWGTLVVKRT